MTYSACDTDLEAFCHGISSRLSSIASNISFVVLSIYLLSMHSEQRGLWMIRYDFLPYQILQLLLTCLYRRL